MECLGEIFGKTTTNTFKFSCEKDVKKFEYTTVDLKEEKILSQITELERDSEQLVAHCRVIGYKDKFGAFKKVKTPFYIGSKVYKATDEFIMEMIKLKDDSSGAYIGKLEGKDIKIYLDINNLITKHVSVLAKSGSGKSYCVGVLLEEILEKGVPLLIIDPHGEYSTLKYPNDDKRDLERMKSFDVKPTNFLKSIREYGDLNVNPNARPIKLPSELSSKEIMELLPGKLTSAQIGILHNSMKNMDRIDFPTLIANIELEESNAKWGLISLIQTLNDYDIFSNNPTPLNELIQPQIASILNFKGIPPEVQDIIVSKLLTDLFEARKKDTIPPFFLVIEEAHNYCPEKTFGNNKSSKIIRTIASEGRKFGLGLCVISQRPARVDKSVVSQCTSQIILKVTNPNDLKSISNSVEGITSETENEIQNLMIGNALITGVVDVPLFVNIRPRKTKHGGETVKILGNTKDYSKFAKEEKQNIMKDIEKFEKKEIMPLIFPTMSPRDYALMSGKDDIKIHLISGYLVQLKGSPNYNVLFDMTIGEVVTDINEYSTGFLPDVSKLTQREIKLLQALFKRPNFTEEQIIQATGTMDILNHLEKLVKLEYLIKKGKNYSLNTRAILSNLSNYQIHQKIEYSSINYEKIKKGNLSVDLIKDKVSKFAQVLDMKECFIVKYE
ncbi:MAG: ATP-binding protein [Candidatus Nanoarchaeia archaeon]|nr:ATP-binding protein [Candidatus Nanoarchaeia archaeon]